MAMCVMAVVAAAPCQCFSPGGIQITSPGRISSIGPPHRRARPQPAVTTSVWPSGCVCHAVRAPGSNVTLAPTTRAGSAASNSGSMRTVPVKYSAGPFPDGCDPLLLMFMSLLSVGLRLVAVRLGDHDVRNGIPRVVDTYEQQPERRGGDDERCDLEIRAQKHGGRCERRIGGKRQHCVPQPVFPDRLVRRLTTRAPDHNGAVDDPAETAHPESDGQWDERRPWNA